MIFITMWCYYKEWSLLGYINVSFIFGAILLFTGLTSYILASGFFDLFYVTSRKIISSKRKLSEITHMRKPSEIIHYNFKFVLLLGLEILLCMGIALIAY
ncbi:DUF3899 domain-containing protein [Rummeliibacillus suwonensis]|uniref:DUF3899 domain-containing protein n=2 Tax=Rummeliibacillus suwonensis TaxID=1306154 RepID=UPI003C7CA7BE